MIQKLTVPPAGERGNCNPTCPFLSRTEETECNVKMDAAETIWQSARPGPECVPGEYAVLPVAEFNALRAGKE